MILALLGCGAPVADLPPDTLLVEISRGIVWVDGQPADNYPPVNDVDNASQLQYQGYGGLGYYGYYGGYYGYQNFGAAAQHLQTVMTARPGPHHVAVYVPDDVPMRHVFDLLAATGGYGDMNSFGTHSTGFVSWAPPPASAMAPGPYTVSPPSPDLVFALVENEDFVALQVRIENLAPAFADPDGKRHRAEQNVSDPRLLSPVRQGVTCADLYGGDSTLLAACRAGKDSDGWRGPTCFGKEEWVAIGARPDEVGELVSAYLDRWPIDGAWTARFEVQGDVPAVAMAQLLVAVRAEGVTTTAYGAGVPPTQIQTATACLVDAAPEPAHYAEWVAGRFGRERGLVFPTEQP